MLVMYLYFARSRNHRLLCALQTHALQVQKVPHGALRPRGTAPSGRDPKIQVSGPSSLDNTRLE